MDASQRSNALAGPHSACLVCGSTSTTNFFHLNRVPIHVNRLWADAQSARQAPLGEIRLAVCRGCGHVYNRAFDPAQLAYDAGYENSLHFSEEYSRYARNTAERLVRQYGLSGKDIVEIGSGKGEFLRLLCELGGSRGVGFDPSYIPDLGPEEVMPAEESGTDRDGPRPASPRPASSRPASPRPGGQIRFVADFYSPRYAGLPADLVCARHVLEHIAEPREMLSQVRDSLSREAVVFFEVPNLLYTLRDLGIWDIIYEHVSYFSPGSLERLFQETGFEVIQVQETFGGQYLTLEARAARVGSKSSEPSNGAAQDIERMASAFTENDRQKWEYWRRVLASLRLEGRRTVVWGAGSKGVTFLNRFRETRPVEWIIDINPRKHGKFIPGAGQQVVGPEILSTYRPEAVLVMNPVYAEEIREVINGYGLNPQYFQV